MRFSFVVEVEVERVQGKFATRDEIEEALQEALDNAESDVELDGLGADGDSEYEVQSWEVGPQVTRRSRA